MSIDINKKCLGYLQIQIIHCIVFMCNCSDVPFLLYDLMISLCITSTIDNVMNEWISRFLFAMLDNWNDLIESGRVFPLVPSMDSINEIPTLDIDIMSGY